MGKCYSQLTYERDNTRSVHGCVESLPQSDKMVCSGQGDVGKFTGIIMGVTVYTRPYTTKPNVNQPFYTCDKFCKAGYGLASTPA